MAFQLQAADWAISKDPLGEFTLVLAGASQESHEATDEGSDLIEAAEVVAMLQATGMPTPVAIKKAAAVTGLKRTVLYTHMLLRKSS